MNALKQLNEEFQKKELLKLVSEEANQKFSHLKSLGNMMEENNMDLAQNLDVFIAESEQANIKIKAPGLKL